MERKSNLHYQITNLILSKSRTYTKENSSPQNIDKQIEGKDTHLRKASEADKERKREKMKLKRKLKREAKARSVKKDPTEASTLALNYLHLWNSSKDTWKFNKKQQYWLLKNIFDVGNISDDNFEILLNYIIDLKGEAKVRLTEESEKIIKEYEDKSKDIDCSMDVTKFERARNVLQILD